MFKRLYYTTALALLPSTDTVLKRIGGLANKLDARTAHLESHLEEKAVQLAKQAKNRRTALDSVYLAGEHIVTKVQSTVESVASAIHDAFIRRERKIISDVSSLREKLDKASQARDAVAKVLDL